MVHLKCNNIIIIIEVETNSVESTRQKWSSTAAVKQTHTLGLSNSVSCLRLLIFDLKVTFVTFSLKNCNKQKLGLKSCDMAPNEMDDLIPINCDFNGLVIVDTCQRLKRISLD